MKRIIHRLFQIGVGLTFMIPAHAGIVNIPPIAWRDSDGMVLTLGEKVELHADNVRRAERYQVRFIRGTKTQIKNGWIKAAAGQVCVRIPATPLLPVKVDNGIINLGYPRIQAWLEEAKSESYVLVLEQIDTPDLRHAVRLKPGFASTYIDRGLEVVLQAHPKPAEPTQSTPVRVFARIWEAIFPTARAAPTQTAPAPPPPPPPKETEMNCLDFK